MRRSVGVFAVIVALTGVVAAETAAPDPAKSAEKAKAAKKAAENKPTGKAAGNGAKAAEPAAEAPTEDAPAEDAPLTPEQIEAQMPPHVKGPKLVDLGHDIEIDLPEGMVLLERDEAQKMIRQGGDEATNVVAAVMRLDSTWLAIIEYDDVGYVDDSDADQLNAAELLESYKKGTDMQNVKRKELGVAELFLDGWSEMPAYQNAARHLVWGLKGHSADGQFINFFTRLLGRNGYISINLIDSPEAIEQAKTQALPILTATHYKAGSRYEDHADGDKSSGLGLRALVLGGTGIAVVKAAKAGILIKLLLVFKKGFIVVFAAIGGFFKWLLGRKKTDDAGLPPEPPAVSGDPPADV
jgi:uncharacterized membrane-anchored protein